MTRPEFFLVEIVVADFARSLSWYRDALSMSVVLLDEPKQFVLLRGVGVGQIALKGGSGAANPDAVRLHLFQPNLDEQLARFAELGILTDGPLRISQEGYRSATLRDPDGYRVYLFEWVTSNE